MSKRQKGLTEEFGGLARVQPVYPYQHGMIAALAETDQQLVVLAGAAGTGKTYLAVCKMHEQILSGDLERLILVRPAMEAGEDLGFLPGTIEEKVEPYMRPFLDILKGRVSKEELRKITDNKHDQIEIAPIAYMRGRTLSDAAVILDEAQNCTAKQLDMVITRLGVGSRIIICGDQHQSDLPARQANEFREYLDFLQRNNIGRIVNIGYDEPTCRAGVVHLIQAAREKERVASATAAAAKPNGNGNGHTRTSVAAPSTPAPAAEIAN